jgi:hypothetical protein
MKHQIASIIAFSLILILVACGPGESVPTDTPEPPPPTVPPPTATQIPEPTSTSAPPTPTPSPTTIPPFRDDFTQVLEDGWTWHLEKRWGWDLHKKPGFLSVEVALDTNQILLRHAPEGDFEISTRVLLTPYSNFQSAGLLIFQDDGHFLSFHRGMCDYIEILPEACQGNAIYFNNVDHDVGIPEEGYSIGPQFPTRTAEISEAYLRLKREGRNYTGYYSDDGENWTLIGKQESDLFPYYVGIWTFGAETYMADAEFDYFTLEALP